MHQKDLQKNKEKFQQQLSNFMNSCSQLNFGDQSNKEIEQTDSDRLMKTIDYFNNFFESIKMVQITPSEFNQLAQNTRLSFGIMPSEDQVIELQKKAIQILFLYVNSSKPSLNKWILEEKQLLDWIVIKYSKSYQKQPSDLVKKLISKFQTDIDWKNISLCFAGRTSIQCKQKWASRSVYSVYKFPWSFEEDQALLEIQKQQKFTYYINSELEKFGQKNKWEKVAQKLKAKFISPVPRPAKQCRERWVNKVDPAIVKGDWDDEDDIQLIYNLLEKGKKWADIKRTLSKQRTEFSIRQRFQLLIQKYKKIYDKEQKLVKAIIQHIRQQLQQQLLIDELWTLEQQQLLIFIIYKFEFKENQNQEKQTGCFLMRPLTLENFQKPQKLALVNLKTNLIAILNCNDFKLNNTIAFSRIITSFQQVHPIISQVYQNFY